MKYAVKNDSGHMIYIASFIKLGSGMRKKMRGYTDTQTIWRQHKPTLNISK